MLPGFSKCTGTFLLLFSALILTNCTPNSGNQKADAPADWFVGQIEYSYSYESDSLNIDSLAALKPWRSIFRYDTATYQSQFIGKDTFTYYYLSAINKAYYQKNSGSETDCEDYSQPTDSIHSFKVYDVPEKILGQACMVLEFQSNYFWNRYYVSKEQKIAPKTYQKHQAYNWSFYGEKAAGGLILGLEHRFKKYTMKGVATSIKQFPSQEQALQVPEAKITEACQ
jgi:hypothetical protein